MEKQSDSEDGKDHRKSLLKGNQEDFFDEASRLRKKCNDRISETKICNKKKEKFVERRSKKREEKMVERING